jgi:nucleoside phosphorylase
MKKSQTVARLTAPGAEPETAASRQFDPSITNMPALPAVNWSAVGAQAPQLVDSSPNKLPASAVVVITWADAEWAAMEHVFCNSGVSMPYSSRNNPSQTGWVKYDKNLPKAEKSSDWNYWGYFRQVKVGSSSVLLFKSNTHLDWPGEQYLESLINQLIADVKPKLILSIGTAGGARPIDHVGTVQVVHAGTLYENNQPQADWPTYSNGWNANWTTISNPQFGKLLFAVPTKASDLQSIASQFNEFYKTNYSLSDLNPDNLNMADPVPKLNNMTTGSTSLLTADSFLVANTSGNLAKFACVEMDDAIIAEACGSKHTAFAFIRNLSDPAQNASLPATVQGNWGQAIYSAYGLYTSYNGAIATWALINSNG